jgi:arylsulfatase A
VELFDLATDIGEQKDLTAQRPDDVARLRRKLADWREEVGAKPAPPNPNYDPAKVKRRR